MERPQLQTQRTVDESPALPGTRGNGHAAVEDKQSTSTVTSSDEESKSAHPHLHKLKESLVHPFPHLRQQLKDTHIYDVKKEAFHLKQKIGKLGNVVNPNHRHDEEHEKETDDKRTKVAEEHRFESFAPKREGQDVKWYVEGRD